MTSIYNAHLKNPRWFEARKLILARDSNKCPCCNSTAKLHIHHRQYHISRRTGQYLLPWKYQSKYLITLCEKCHTAGHEKFKIPTFNI